MECLEIRFCLTDYEDGTLEPTEREIVQTHLKECGSCERVHFKLNHAWNSLDALTVEDPDPFSCRRFLTKFKQENRSKFLFSSVLELGKHRFRFAAYFFSLVMLVFVIYAALALKQNLYLAKMSSRQFYATTLSKFSASIFQPTRIFPNEMSGYSYNQQAVGELSRFDLGSVQGPFSETTIVKEEKP